ncbi:chromate efflux transporter [Pseudoxanthomonas sp. LH2527]|uniref:chromate efflux transporter n=1 Tax=Pseudoxanthomonas sp. LH2527 TaxID=2923249 RepID=UPI001F12AFA6|nr:chromate efflux transporter [Pseudoxanthomonas sp. LH2527]MCH6482951.1 chromate efflux transporter [Pseudoxanthomonas sp. LH2527]
MEAWRVFLVFLRLGLTSFGGPIAHLGYFREAFVVRRQWLGEAEYADIVALCQVLPGPASSQVGMVVGLGRAGLPGALAAWCGFTLPSALLMVALGASLSQWRDALPEGLILGFKLLAVVVVAQAVWGMARVFCRDAVTWLLMLACAAALWVWPMAGMQVAVIVAGALVGLGLRVGGTASPPMRMRGVPSRRVGVLALVAFALLLVASWVWSGTGSSAAVFGAFYRAGALVFGGGHVVMPLLQSGVVAPGWLSQDAFLAGYGAAQAVPGPMFTFAGYLGAAMQAGPGGWMGGALAIIAIFLPAWLLVMGVLPFWQRMVAVPRMRSALAGINAAVVGLLLAAVCDPLWSSAVSGIADAMVVVAGFVALVWARLPVGWMVVAIPLAGMALHALA